MSQETELVRQLGGEEQVSDVVLQAVADISNRSVLGLPPLQESIDVDALEELFDSSGTVQSLRFEYAGCEVTVEPNRVRVSEA